MQLTEMRQKTVEELESHLKKLSKDLHDTVVSVLQRKEKNVRKPGQVRLEIARVKTIINEKKFLGKK